MSNAKDYWAILFTGNYTYSLKLKMYRKFIYDLFIGMYNETFTTFNEYKQLLSNALTVRCDIY